jgi:glycosyltransferase involved in cell wall biosynthesis
MSYPLLSAKMITYGRVEFLQESLHSFLIQDYPGEKELVIVNDYPLQKLKFDHPEVRIYNLDETFKTIGEKENYATELCKGDIICQWDDDDIAMPWHLTNVAKYFIPGSDLLHWQKGVYFNNSEITAITSLGNSGIVFSKKIWNHLGGHPIENAGYDMTFVMNIKRTSKNIILASPLDNEVSWFYMWGGRGYHMSGMGTDTSDRANVIQRHSNHVETLRKQGKIPIGEIELLPNWKIDYQLQLNEYVRKS